MQNKPYILITGATSSIGASIAHALAVDYPLIIHGRSIEQLEKLKQELPTSNPVEYWEYDLSKAEDLKSSLKDFIMSKQLQVSGFVHCAGTLKILPFKNFRDDYVQEIFNVNLFSAISILQVLLLKYNLPVLNRVLFISALYSKRGNKGNSIYSASKGAIDSLVKSLALELAPQINVNSILPGAIPTQMTQSLYDDPEKMEAIAHKYPLGYGQCQDIALMVNYLLGNGGRWITAQNIHVDGGASMF